MSTALTRLQEQIDRLGTGRAAAIRALSRLKTGKGGKATIAYARAKLGGDRLALEAFDRSVAKEGAK